MHLREAARQLGIAPATVFRWIERLQIETLALPDGRRYLRAVDVERIKQARDDNNYATETSRGMHRYWEAQREEKETA